MLVLIRRTAIVVLLGSVVLLAFHYRNSRHHKAINHRKFEAAAWGNSEFAVGSFPTLRQQMIADLILTVLPGKNKEQITELLGCSPTHDDMRRYLQSDIDNHAPKQPIPRNGNGHYYEEYEWDLIYHIGPLERPRGIWDTDMQEQYLIVRFSDAGIFGSWYITDGEWWRTVVGSEAAKSFRRERK